MSSEDQEYEDVGYIKYSGNDVERGIIDAGSAGSALTGLDEAIRFFNTQQSPDFATLQYDVPVQIRAGSWEAVVMGSALAVGGAFALGYAKKAGEKLAENDFKDIGLKDILKKSMTAIQTLAKVVKHTRRARGWKTDRFALDDPTGTVLIVNDKGEELPVPTEFYRWFQQLPPRLLIRMTSVIRTERVLSIGIARSEKIDEVHVNEEDKPLFDDTRDEEEDEDILLPELVHGQDARLEGRLIRGNEASNTAGLEYQGHVINCVPAHGSVRQYKAALFLRCKVEGRITRHAKSRFVADRRPTLIVEKVVPLETDPQLGLFGG